MAIIKALGAIRETRKNPVTHLMVSVYDGIAAGVDTRGGRWIAVCEEHSTMVNHKTREGARLTIATPYAWCDECRTLTGRK